MCEKEINKSCTCKNKLEMNNCDYAEIYYSLHTSGCKRRTFISKHCKSLVMGYSFNKMSKINYPSFLSLQITIFIFALGGFMLVEASEQYNRLSISDTNSFVEDSNNHLSASQLSDFRHVSYEELLTIGNGFDNFTDPGVTHFSEILFDFDHYQIVVGARDTLYRLDLKGLSQLEKTTWTATPSDMGMCTVKGQTEEDCHNFVKVLVSHRDRVFACGTNAFNPKCSWRNIQEISRVIKSVDGRAKCPYSPHSNITAMMTGANGDYYIASEIDSSSNDPAIYRMAAGGTKGFGSEQFLRTSQFNPLWLSRTDFVGSFETRRFMYFLFRETATEAMNCGKAVYSRIARVCKNDEGYNYLKNKRENKWTTFLKARLNCSVPGDYPFYFNEIQSAFYVNDNENEDNGVVYAVFTTPENSIAGSAICSFNLTSIERTFKGPFKTRENGDPTKTWRPDISVLPNDRSGFECERPSTSPNEVDSIDSRKYQLMDETVESTTFGPLYHETSLRYTHIVVDTVNTKYGRSSKVQHGDSYSGSSAVHVLFVTVRDYGMIKKISYNANAQKSCIVEILHPFPNLMRSIAHPKIYTMKFKAGLGTETESLYLGTNDGLLRVPTSRCIRFKSKSYCLSSGDPYCGWNSQIQKCTAAPNKNPSTSYWEQSPVGFTCPDTNININAGWGQWSDWNICSHSASTNMGYYRISDSSLSTSPENSLGCLCRNRKCNQAGQNDGRQICNGIQGGHSIEVTNCTRNGQWTSWSEWSSCSKSCDVGRRYRQRSCGNPAPAFGGRVCVGRDRDSDICNDLPPCNGDKGKELSVLSTASLTRYSGNDRSQWTSWLEWSKCSTDNQCGKGFRSRKRHCKRSVGLSVTTCDESCSSQYEECFSRNGNCSSHVDVSDYTPWVRILKQPSQSLNLGRGWSEQRFLFVYHGTAVNAAQNSNLGDRIVTQERYCVSEGKCSSVTPRSTKQGWNKNVLNRWSEWSACTRECGGGKQVKLLSCSRLDDERACQGREGYITVVERACNTHPCPSQWTCWSDWSECGSDGMVYRQRRCKDPQSSILSSKIKDCGEEQSYQEKRCGSLLEDENENTVTVKASTAEATMSMVVGAAIICLIIGVLLGAGIMFYVIRFRCKGILNGSANGGPHYVSAKSQNLYVSLPMLDLTNTSTITSTSTLGRPKGKYFGGCVTSNGSDQSDFGTIRSTSTLRSKAGSSIYNNGHHKGSVVGSEYETATIKRSHSQRNSSLINGAVAMRADLDSDNIFT